MNGIDKIITSLLEANDGKMPQPTWNVSDDKLAAKMGWGLFESNGSVDGPWQVQRIDVPKGDDGVLDDDTDAWEYIASHTDNLTCRRVVAFLWHENPMELGRMQGWTRCQQWHESKKGA